MNSSVDMDTIFTIFPEINALAFAQINMVKIGTLEREPAHETKS